MSHHASTLWLKISSILLIVLGALFSWTTTGPLMAANLGLVDFIVWPMDAAQSYTATETRLLAAISGGLTAGFGMCFYMMTKYIYENDPVLGGRMILSSIVTWYVVDGIGSVIAGVTFNVFANITFLVMIALPVLLAMKTRNSVAV